MQPDMPSLKSPFSIRICDLSTSRDNPSQGKEGQGRTLSDIWSMMEE